MDWSIVFDNTDLFKDVSIRSKEYIQSHAQIHKVYKMESFNSDESVLVFIIEGSAMVYGNTKRKSILLNTFYRGEIFGMASLFGGKCETTKIVAKENCVFALLSQKEVEEVMKEDIVFTRNYITFLSDKIRFLNRKIAFFTSGSTEKKVMAYLSTLPIENNQIKVEVSFTKLALMLDMGRASLYRALDTLEEQGLYKRDGNIFTIFSIKEFTQIIGENV